MDWIPIFALFLANAGLILWVRSESRKDWKMIYANLQVIREEMRDFHGRLCAIEERNSRRK